MVAQLKFDGLRIEKEPAGGIGLFVFTDIMVDESRGHNRCHMARIFKVFLIFSWYQDGTCAVLLFPSCAARRISFEDNALKIFFFRYKRNQFKPSRKWIHVPGTTLLLPVEAGFPAHPAGLTPGRILFSRIHPAV
jgi:hypothetical protein